MNAILYSSITLLQLSVSEEVFCSFQHSLTSFPSFSLSRFLLVTPAIDVTRKIFSKNMSANFLPKSIKIKVMKSNEWEVNQTEKSELCKSKKLLASKPPDVVSKKGRKQSNCHSFDAFISSTTLTSLIGR